MDKTLKLFFILLLTLSSYGQVMQVGVVGSSITVTVSGPTVSYIGGCVNSASALTNNCTASPSSTSGNILVAVSKVQNNSGNGVPTFSTTGVTCPWRRLLVPTDISTGNSYNATVYACIMSSSGTAVTTVTWTGTTGGPFTDLSISEYHSTATWNASLFDRSTVLSNTTSTTSCPTATTALATQNANDLLLAICVNFNNAQTWGTLSGWTTHAASNRNTTGVYSKTQTATATQTATVPLSSADRSNGILIALQASNVHNCSGCVLVQSTNSSGQNIHFDQIALSGVVEGDTLVYYVFHNSWSGSGTTSMTDSSGTNIWYPCNTNTGGATSVTMTDLQFTSTFGMSCFYALNVPTGGTITGMPLATDCATSCSFVGGAFMEFKGPVAWDAFSSNANASSTTSPNNVNCGSMTTTQANDLIICGSNVDIGTPTAGTVPTSFTMYNTVNAAMEDGVWSGSGTTSPTQSLSGSGVTYGAMGLGLR